MTVWLDAGQVANMLNISRRTALTLMYQMPHSVIGGTVRKRIRVSEANLDSWMVKRSNKLPIADYDAGSKKKLKRR